MKVMPNLSERDEVRKYCCERPLVRPNTNIKTAIVSMLLFASVAAGVSFGIYQLISRLGNRFHIHWFISHPVTVSVVACTLCFLLILKRAIIGCVRFYQHYAPEDIRRKCILKPTCSEYMILAVNKYGVFTGMKKSIYRLLVTCRGWDYRIDEP